MAVKDSNKQTEKVSASDCCIHILLLVAGTTSPVNVNHTRANSFVSGDLYWHKEKERDFYTKIKEYVDAQTNLEVFHYHGWSGDNRKENRETAGKYLINRLVGAEGEEAFYEENWQKKEIKFHLLGHSHGGNVINEMTQQIAKLGSQWPETWKIKSLIYLSTPFFKKLHQVNYSSSFFAPDAEVFNAHNDYDLTQRMLADFSLEALREGLDGLDTTGLDEARKNLSDMFKRFPLDILTHRGFGKVFDMSREDGITLYNATDELLDKFILVLVQLQKMIESLEEPYTFTPAVESKPGLGAPAGIINQRTLISTSTATKFKAILDLLIVDVKAIQKKLAATLRDLDLNPAQKEMSKIDWIDDVLEGTVFLANLINLLDINPLTLTSGSHSLCTLLYELLDHNIQHFDNTYQKPDQQLKGTALAEKIEDSDVTIKDPYHGSIASTNYRQFIQAIEAIEQKYEADPSQYNLFDLLFTLIANSGGYIDYIHLGIYLIDKVEWLATGSVDTLLKQFKAALENFRIVINARNYSTIESKKGLGWVGLIDERQSSPDPYAEETRGSIMYLLVESHSVSRHKFHKQLKTFLDRVGPAK